MKSLQELYNEAVADNELKTQWLEAVEAGSQEVFLKEHGCEATTEELRTFFEAKANEDAPLSFDELENAAGGACNGKTGMEVAISIISLGTGCLGIAINSAMKGRVGQKASGEGRLCN